MQSNTIRSASKWSLITEFSVKVITPLANIILARLLTPEAFGVIATITIIVSLAEVFQDAGFQKYIVQHDYKREEDLNTGTGVAFSASVVFSSLLWLIISIFSKELSYLIGNEDLQLGLVVACISLPLTALTGVPMARYRRDFRFKELFVIRILEVFTPLYITIPVAIFIFPNYWALIAGTLGRLVIRAMTLYVINKKSGRYAFKFEWDSLVFKEMFGFSMWTTFEYVTIWLTTNSYIFIIARILQEHYVGVFNVSVGLISALFGLFSAAFIPVAFSAFSRQQNNLEQLREIYYSFQRHLSFFLLPMAVITYCFQDVVQWILLGEKWSDASFLLGVVALISSVVIVGGHLASEVYRSLGKPKLSSFVQCATIVIIIPTIYLGAKSGFETLCMVYPIPRFFSLCFHAVALFYIARITPWKTIYEIFPFLISSIVLFPIAYALRNIFIGHMVSILCMLFLGILYCTIVWVIPKGRKEIIELFEMFRF